MTIKDKFYKIYSNLPLNLRDEIILVLSKEPITWRIAKLEIDNNTEIGNIILEKLEHYKFI